MYFALEPKFSKYRHAAHRIFKPRHHTIIISFKKFILRVPRAMVFPNGIGIFLFVDANETGLLFHPDISGHKFIVANDGKFSFQILEFRHSISDKVMVGHRSHRQLQTTPFSHLSRVSSSRIDHMFAGDISKLGEDFPLSI